MGQQERRSARRPGQIVAIVVAFLTAFAAPAFAATWTDHQLPSVGQSPLFDISCPSTSLCVAVGGGNTLASSTNPTGPAAAYPGGAGPVVPPPSAPVTKRGAAKLPQSP